MSLSFETQSFNNISSSSSFNSDPNKSKMVEFLIKKGIVKSESAGNAVLLVFALVLIALSGYMMYNTLKPAEIIVPTPEEVISDQAQDL